MKYLRIIFRIITGFISVALITICSILAFVNLDEKVEPVLKDQLRKNINADVKYSKAEIAFFSTFPNVSLVVSEMFISDSVDNSTIFFAKKLQLNVGLKNLLQGKVECSKIYLDSPFLHYIVDSNGIGNLSNIIKVDDTSQNIQGLHTICIDQISISHGKVRYDNNMLHKSAIARDLNLKFSAVVDADAHLIELSKGKLYMGENELGFEGFVNDRNIDVDFDIQLGNINGILDVVSRFIDPRIREVGVSGNFLGKCKIAGAYHNIDSVEFTANVVANNLNVTNPEDKDVVSDGEFDVDLRYNHKQLDNSRVNINKFDLRGDDVNLKANGQIRFLNSIEYFLSMNVKAKGNIGKVSNYYSLLPKGMKLGGKVDCDVKISSTLSELLKGYNIPKMLGNINIKSATSPTFYGTVNVSNFLYRDDTSSITADRIRFAVDSRTIEGKTKIDNLKLQLNKKNDVRNKSVIAKQVSVESSGRTFKSVIKASELGYFIKAGSGFISNVSANNIKMNVDVRKNVVATADIEGLGYHKDSMHIVGRIAKIDLRAIRDKQRNYSFESSVGLELVSFLNKGIQAYSKKITGGIDYNGLWNINAISDSISLSDSSKNKLNLLSIKFNYGGKGKIYSGTISRALSKELRFPLSIDLHNINVSYSDKLLQTKIVKAICGSSDMSVAGTVDFSSKGKTKVRGKLGGRFFNLTEILLAKNKYDYLEGVPTAINPDSLSKGEMPRFVMKESSDMEIALNLDSMRLSVLDFSNVNGNIYVKGKRSLFKDITSTQDNGSAFILNTLYSYKDPDHADLTVSVKSRSLDIDRLGAIIPTINHVSPMIPALQGTIDCEINLSYPIYHKIVIDFYKINGAASIKADNLSIENNETFQEVAKTLMFKNKQSTKIDSLAVAATLRHGHVKILPFMLKIDRYKVAIGGENDMVKKEVNYHISVLKSPVPFKFGLKITGGNPKFKISIVKTQYKHLDPSVKPWLDSNYSAFRDSIVMPITDMSKSVL